MGTCISTSVIAVKMDCRDTRSGKDARRWAWITAAVSGIVAVGALAF